MRRRARAHLTPILLRMPDNTAAMRGTGSFFNDGHTNFLLTCQHVTRAGKGQPLLLLFKDQEVTVPGPYSEIVQHPEDLSLAPIDNDIWGRNTDGMSRGLTMEDFSTVHQPVDGEVLFFLGIPGYGSRYIVEFGVTFANAHSCLIPEVPAVYGDPRFVFRVDYRTALMRDVEGGRDEMPTDPHGFSGSLVWNTRYTEITRRGGEWTPDTAQVTGMIQRWDSARAELMCCRCETIRSFIDYVLTTDADKIPLTP